MLYLLTVIPGARPDIFRRSRANYPTLAICYYPTWCVCSLWLWVWLSIQPRTWRQRGIILQNALTHLIEGGRRDVTESLLAYLGGSFGEGRNFPRSWKSTQQRRGHHGNFQSYTENSEITRMLLTDRDTERYMLEHIDAEYRGTYQTRARPAVLLSATEYLINSF